MNDLERALRGTLADPPVEVPESSHAEYDIEARIERRRSRQKRAATGLVAAAVAAAIAVPVATSTGGPSGEGSASRAAGGAGQLKAQGAERTGQGAAVGTPAAVQKTARALAQEYGRPTARAQWVRTSPARWDRLRHETSGTEHTSEVYVLQFPRYRCTIHCPNLPETSTQPTALVATVATTGKRLAVAFTRTYDLAALGTVHTFTVR